MGEHRQVLMVTHRPQFIVNLDVDNVILSGKKMTRYIFALGLWNIGMRITISLISFLTISRVAWIH